MAGQARWRWGKLRPFFASKGGEGGGNELLFYVTYNGRDRESKRKIVKGRLDSTLLQ